MNTDKKTIWTECPRCARKHLLAAYALLTQGDSNIVSVGAFRLLLARAEIAITEAQAGYTGNASLASGCLAAAECTAARYLKPDLRHELRDVRLDVDKMYLESAITRLWHLLAMDDCESRAAAHLAEAHRELPAMWDKTLGLFRNGGYHYDDKQELLGAIITKVREIEETYELGTGLGTELGTELGTGLGTRSGDPTPSDFNASAQITDSNARLMAATESLLATSEGRAELAAFGQTMAAVQKEARKERGTNG